MSHQTVRLDPGRHRPGEGRACVLELASLLGGEPFSDSPRSVCPVVAAFLRRYQDELDDDRRADLYGVAAAIVGSRADADTERARREHVRRRLAEIRPGTRRPLAGRAAVALATAYLDHGDHEGAMETVDELLAIGSTASADPVLAVAGPVPRTASVFGDDESDF